MSYFNEIAGGPANGHRHLLGSNLDWGQDLFLIKEWQDQHPDCRPLYVAYYLRLVDPQTAGIDCLPVPEKSAYRITKSLNPQSSQPHPGWYVIGINRLKKRDGGPAFLLGRQPVDRIGHTMFVFHIED